MESSLVDTLLDRSIALGYGTVGLQARRRLPGWPADPPRMDGAAVLVTGAAGGLGLASSVGVARLGATVHALARSQRRAEEAVERITAKVPSADVRPVSCDVSDLRAVRTFGEEFAGREPRLDVLINNAGVMPADRTSSPDGHELMFATHVLAPLALTATLAPLLERSTPAGVVNVSSGGMYSPAAPGGCRFSARSPRRSSAAPKTARTRSSGSAVRPRRSCEPGSSGMTGEPAPPTTASEPPPTRKPTVTRSGATVSRPWARRASPAYDPTA
jgi:dehydrogenase/reductase SDR family protein 12